MAPAASAPRALSSLGPLPHPAAAALQARALQDMNRMLADGDALFDPGQGTACQVSWALDEKAAEAIRAQGLAKPAPPIAYGISMVSGACPAQPDPAIAPVFAGPVQYINHEHYRNEISPGMLSDTIWTSRVSAVVVQGRAVGEETTLRRLYSKSYRRLQSGEVIQEKTPGFDFDRPTYQATYVTHDGQGGLLRPTVTFSYALWNPSAKVDVTVGEQTGPGRTAVTQFEGGQRKSLLRMRDGILHGWAEYFDPAVVRALGGSNRQCYQNGQLVKATQCPD